MSVLTQSPVDSQRVRFEPPTRYIDDTAVRLPAIDEFEAIRPIMSRLPPAADEEDTAHLISDEEYVTISQRNSLPGTLPNSDLKVLYTASRLPSVSSADEAIWQALHHLRPLTANYAGDFGSSPPSIPSGCPFSRSSSRSRTALDLVRSTFNWSSLRLPRDISGTFYGVVFRSKRRDGSASKPLYAADKLSHEEAVRSGGLLMYWYGVPDPHSGANLATCIWASREDASRASRLPLHKEAARLAGEVYQSFELSRYAVVKREGEERLRLEEWRDEYL